MAPLPKKVVTVVQDVFDVGGSEGHKFFHQDHFTVGLGSSLGCSLSMNQIHDPPKH